MDAISAFNWRPVTLLCVDFKMLSANRMKKILPCQMHKKGCFFSQLLYIGECTRPAFDLMDE
jgi:hypothetical protein